MYYNYKFDKTNDTLGKMSYYEIYECEPLSKFYAFTLSNISTCIEPVSDNHEDDVSDIIVILSQVFYVMYMLSEELVMNL